MVRCFLETQYLLLMNPHLLLWFCIFLQHRLVSEPVVLIGAVDLECGFSVNHSVRIRKCFSDISFQLVRAKILLVFLHLVVIVQGMEPPESPTYNTHSQIRTTPAFEQKYLAVFP